MRLCRAVLIVSCLSTEFIIQYEESQWEPGSWKELLRVPGNLHSSLLKLHGHVDYRFRVAGVNAVGRGAYSEPTERYKTPPAGLAYIMPLLLFLLSYTYFPFFRCSVMHIIAKHVMVCLQENTSKGFLQL